MSLYLGKLGRRILKQTVENPRLKWLNRALDAFGKVAHKATFGRYTPGLTRVAFLLHQNTSPGNLIWIADSHFIRNNAKVIAENPYVASFFRNNGVKTIEVTKDHTPENLANLMRKNRAQFKQSTNAEVVDSRRKFIRAIALGSAAGLVGSSIAWCIMKSCTRPKQNIKLKKIALNILREVEANKTMSPRYEKFIRVMIKLIEDDRIIFDETNGSERYSHYLAGENKVVMNLKHKGNDFSFKESFIHELFHAYQDYQKRPLRTSILEAEAHLASSDYLLHHGVDICEFWIKLESVPGKGKRIGRGFNIPKSLLETVRGKSFTSPEYKKVLGIVANKYIWPRIFLILFNSSYVQKVIKGVAQLGLSVSEVENKRREFLNQIKDIVASKTGQPLTVKGPGPSVSDIRAYKVVGDFLAASACLVSNLWLLGRRKEAVAFINKTFTEFKDALIDSTDTTAFEKIPMKGNLGIE